MSKRCYGCMKLKNNSPVCEHCGYNEHVPNYPHQLPVGTVLKGQYTVGKVLGQGGFGITYIGWDDALEAPVAIKEYYPNSLVTRECTLSMEVSCTSREAEDLFQRNRDRFLKEARVLARLQNIPGIVRVHNLFRENNTAYIVMEYVEGINLRDYIRSQGRPLSVGQTLTVLQPVMEALKKVHEAELVHRDISPDNIMIQRDGSPKLLDFGAAKEVIDANVEKNLSQSTESILKYGFAPIEQYQRRGNLGPWTDVYALCATAYYCLTGTVPADAPERMIEQIPVNWDAIPGLTAKQAAAFTQGMALLPKDRISSIQALQQALYEQPVHDKEPEKPPKKPPVAAIAAVLAVVAAAGLFLRKTKNQPETPAVPETKPAVIRSTENTTPEEQSVQFLPEANAAECLLLDNDSHHNFQHSYFTYLENIQKSTQLIESENLFISVKDNKEVTITVSGLNIKDSYLVNTGFAQYQTEYRWEVTLFGDTAVKLYTGYRTDNPDTESKEIPFSAMNTIFYARRADGIFAFTGIQPQLTYTSDSITWVFTIPEEYPDFFKDGLPEPFDFTTLKQVSVQIQEGINAPMYCACYNPRNSSSRPAPTAATYTQIAAGLDHTVVLFSDGTVKAIGSNEYGQCDVEDWTDILRICAFEKFTLGLRENGTVVVAGSCDYAADFTGWRDIVSLSASQNHTLGLRSDGTVVSAGGAPRYADASTWRSITAIGAAYTNSVGLRENGTVVVKGTYRDGDLSGWDHITAISVSDSHFLGLRSDGTVKAAGLDNHDQCDVEDWTDIVAVGAGCGYSVGLRNDGTVLVQGLNDNGQHEARYWTDIVYISVGLDHIIGVKADGTFVSTGDNDHGECDVAQFCEN